MALHIWVMLVIAYILHPGLTKAGAACGAHWKLEIGDSRTFTSPRYPKPFRKSVQCRWKITTNENSITSITCKKFQVKESPMRCIDQFYFFEHVKQGPICHNGNQSVNFVTTAKDMEVYFDSAPFWWKHVKGFKCTIKVFENKPTYIYDDCGKENSRGRIVSGVDALKHEYPYQVALRRIKSDSHLCGGSLISRNWVLTAAHCVYGYKDSDIFINLGDHDIDTGLETNHTVKRYVSNIIVHFGYIEHWSPLATNDIAVLQLSKPVEYSYGISPVCLPINDKHRLFDEKMALVAGWGATYSDGTNHGPVSNKLQVRYFPVITNTKCEKMSRWKIWDDQICTYTKGSSPCYGDSGGPLLIEDDNGRWQQIGIVSGAAKDGCANKGDPAVYTRVTAYIDWIEEKTNTKFCTGY